MCIRDRCSSKVVNCEDACFKISGIYQCDLREASLESDKDHSEKSERNAACPTLDVYKRQVLYCSVFYCLNVWCENLYK